MSRLKGANIETASSSSKPVTTTKASRCDENESDFFGPGIMTGSHKVQEQRQDQLRT